MADSRFQRVDAGLDPNRGMEKMSRPPISYFAGAWQRLRRNPMAMISLGVILLLFFLAFFGPSLRGVDYTRINAGMKNRGLSLQFWFGADDMGRDLFSRLWLGLRVSLIVALVCGSVQIILGSLIGGIMGYFGGPLDIVIMRIIEIISAVPSLLVTMIIMMVLGNGVYSLLIAISITSWCGTARQIRGQVMQLREIEYILAAEVMGSSSFRTIVRHLLPNTIGIIIVNLTSSIPGYIFIESGLSFVGLGLQPPNTSLGTLISSGQVHMDFAPHQLLFPCLILCLTVLAFNLLGDGLRNALDPKLRR
jgi:oligopeptide transport system permease protein